MFFKVRKYGKFFDTWNLPADLGFSEWAFTWECSRNPPMKQHGALSVSRDTPWHGSCVTLEHQLPGGWVSSAVSDCVWGAEGRGGWKVSGRAPVGEGSCTNRENTDSWVWRVRGCLRKTRFIKGVLALNWHLVNARCLLPLGNERSRVLSLSLWELSALSLSLSHFVFTMRWHFLLLSNEAESSQASYSLPSCVSKAISSDQRLFL